MLFTGINTIRLLYWDEELKAQFAPKYLGNLYVLSKSNPSGSYPVSAMISGAT